MIGRILAGRPHLARSASSPGQDSAGTILRLLAQLIAERVPVNLDPLFAVPPGQQSSLLKPAGKRRIVVSRTDGRKNVSTPLLHQCANR